LATDAVVFCKMGSAIPRRFDRRHPGWSPTAFSRRFRCEESQRPVVRTVARMSVGGTVSGGTLPRQVPGSQVSPKSVPDRLGVFDRRIRRQVGGMELWLG
jgi:hypothetical protein